MSGVTNTVLRRRSQSPGSLMFECSICENASRDASNTATARTPGPSTATTPIRYAVDSRISPIWKREAEVTSRSRSEWCTRCRRHIGCHSW